VWCIIKNKIGKGVAGPQEKEKQREGREEGFSCQGKT